jgi:hypothetical protein
MFSTNDVLKKTIMMSKIAVASGRVEQIAKSLVYTGVCINKMQYNLHIDKYSLGFEKILN